MKKEYTYENVTVSIVWEDTSTDIIKEATKLFLKRIIKEEQNNGNSNKSRTIRN